MKHNPKSISITTFHFKDGRLATVATRGDRHVAWVGDGKLQSPITDASVEHGATLETLLDRFPTGELREGHFAPEMEAAFPR